MTSEWHETTIGAAFDVNPSRPLKRGAVAPFVPMDLLPVNARAIERIESREYTGSGMRFRNGDTLIARITPCLENGKTAFVSGLVDGEVAHGSTEYIVLSGKDSQSDSLFGYYLARTSEFRRYAISHMEGTSGRQRVPSSAIEKFPITLPPLEQQRAIAHILGTLDDKIELNRRMNQTLEDMARALFKSWFVDFDGVAPEDMQESELGLIPKGWRAVKLEALCSRMVNGGTPKRNEESFWRNGEIPWFKTGELFDSFLLEPSERITSQAVESSSVKILPRHAVLMAIYAAPTVGRLGVLTEDAAFNQACTGMVAQEHVGTWFLLQTLRHGRDWYNSRANGAAQQNISKEIVGSYQCVLPDEAILDRFNDVAAVIYSRIESNSHQIAALAILRDTLLSHLISGELRVRDAEHFVETVDD